MRRALQLARVGVTVFLKDFHYTIQTESPFCLDLPAYHVQADNSETRQWEFSNVDLSPSTNVLKLQNGRPVGDRQRGNVPSSQSLAQSDIELNCDQRNIRFNVGDPSQYQNKTFAWKLYRDPRNVNCFVNEECGRMNGQGDNNCLLLTFVAVTTRLNPCGVKASTSASASHSLPMLADVQQPLNSIFAPCTGYNPPHTYNCQDVTEETNWGTSAPIQCNCDYENDTGIDNVWVMTTIATGIAIAVSAALILAVDKWNPETGASASIKQLLRQPIQSMWAKAAHSSKTLISYTN